MTTPTIIARALLHLLALSLCLTTIPSLAHATVDAGSDLSILRVSPQGRMLVGKGSIADEWHSLFITAPSGRVLEKLDIKDIKAARTCLASGVSCEPRFTKRLALDGLDEPWKPSAFGTLGLLSPSGKRYALCGLRPDGLDIWILEGDWIIHRSRWRFKDMIKSHTPPQLAWSTDGRVLTVDGELLVGIWSGAHHWKGFVRSIVIDRPEATGVLEDDTIVKQWLAWSDAAERRCSWDAEQCYLAQSGFWMAVELDKDNTHAIEAIGRLRGQ